MRSRPLERSPLVSSMVTVPPAPVRSAEMTSMVPIASQPLVDLCWLTGSNALSGRAVSVSLHFARAHS